MLRGINILLHMNKTPAVGHRQKQGLVNVSIFPPPQFNTEKKGVPRKGALSDILKSKQQFTEMSSSSIQSSSHLSIYSTTIKGEFITAHNLTKQAPSNGQHLVKSLKRAAEEWDSKLCRAPGS